MERLMSDLQPSQLYLSEKKISQVKTWFDPKTTKLSPLPIKQIGDRVFLTDGHTRAFVAYEAGWETVPVVWDNDDLDWDFYLACVEVAEAEGVLTVADLGNRILTAVDYQTKWLDWCQDFEKKRRNTIRSTVPSTKEIGESSSRI